MNVGELRGLREENARLPPRHNSWCVIYSFETHLAQRSNQESSACQTLSDLPAHIRCRTVPVPINNVVHRSKCYQATRPVRSAQSYYLCAGLCDNDVVNTNVFKFWIISERLIITAWYRYLYIYIRFPVGTLPHDKHERMSSFIKLATYIYRILYGEKVSKFSSSSLPRFYSVHRGCSCLLSPRLQYKHSRFTIVIRLYQWTCSDVYKQIEKNIRK